MPYAESLETSAEWFAQLWAESLGKDDLGQTPVRALGVTDQHSQLQLYRAGPRDKLVTFVTTRESEDRPIPDTDVEELAYLGDATLGELLEAEFEATEPASPPRAGRTSASNSSVSTSTNSVDCSMEWKRPACSRANSTA